MYTDLCKENVGNEICLKFLLGPEDREQKQKNYNPEASGTKATLTERHTR